MTQRFVTVAHIPQKRSRWLSSPASAASRTGEICCQRFSVLQRPHQDKRAGAKITWFSDIVKETRNMTLLTTRPPVRCARINRCCALVLALTVVPRTALGQSTTSHWPGLCPACLETVFVQDDAGTEVSGKLVGLNPEALVLLIDGVERRIDRDQVRRIQKRDSLKNGAIIGAVVGAVFGVLGAGISDCPGSDPGGSCPGARTTIAALSVITYAGFGMGLDAMVKGRTTIYAASPGSQKAVTAGHPRDRAAALQMRLSW